jgi:hypothetical protein
MEPIRKNRKLAGAMGKIVIVETMTGARKVKAITTATTTGITIAEAMTATVIVATIVRTGAVTVIAIIGIATGRTQPGILAATAETVYTNTIPSGGARDTVHQVWLREATIVWRPDMKEGGQSDKGYRAMWYFIT